MSESRPWPVWLKRLSAVCGWLVGLSVLAAIALWAPCFGRGCDGWSQVIVSTAVILPLVGVVLLGWIAGYLLFRCKGKAWLGWLSVALAVVGAVAAAMLFADVRSSGTEMNPVVILALLVPTLATIFFTVIAIINWRK